MIIKIDKNICKGCQRCCHGIPGNKVAAILNDGTRPTQNKHHRCEYLNRRNQCDLKSNKPFECSIYPIIVLEDGIYIDQGCPEWKTAVEQWTKRFGLSADDLVEDDSAKYVTLWIAQSIKNGGDTTC